LYETDGFVLGSDYVLSSSDIEATNTITSLVNYNFFNVLLIISWLLLSMVILLNWRIQL